MQSFCISLKKYFNQYLSLKKGIQVKRKVYIYSYTPAISFRLWKKTISSIHLNQKGAISLRNWKEKNVWAGGKQRPWDSSPSFSSTGLLCLWFMYKSASASRDGCGDGIDYPQAAVLTSQTLPPFSYRAEKKIVPRFHASTASVGAPMRELDGLHYEHAVMALKSSVSPCNHGWCVLSPVFREFMEHLN